MLKGIYKWKNSHCTAVGTETGPRSAYSGTGFLVAAASSALYQGKSFEIISPFLGEGNATGKQSLMTFWYSMDGAAMGDLELWCDTKDGRRKVWFKSGEQGSEWKKALAEIPATQCRFIAKTGGAASDIAIDDVKYEQKVADLSCSFENDLCDDWTVDTETPWLRNKGATGTYDTGPISGAGGADSWYMYVLSADQYGRTFELSSRIFMTSEATTLKFKYNMHGAEEGSLKVVAVKSDDTLLVPDPFEKTGEQNSDPAQWIDAEVTIPAGIKQLKFVGTTGSEGKLSDMAIDEIEFVFSPKY